VKYHVRISYKAEQDVAGVLEWFRDQLATAAGGRWMAAAHIEFCFKLTIER
jgi:hypothetical protein